MKERYEKVWRREQGELRQRLGERLSSVERAETRSRLLSVTASLGERERRIDALSELPAIWHTIYGDTPGFVALFTGVRAEPAARLSETHETFYAWPSEVPAAL